MPKTSAQLDREIAEALGYRVAYGLVTRRDGKIVTVRAIVDAPRPLTLDEAVKWRRQWGRSATAWIETMVGTHVPVSGAMRPGKFVGDARPGDVHASLGAERTSSSHATQRSHSTKAMSNGLFAVEIDRSAFDSGRDLPDGARWRADRAKLAEEELARGRSYRRPKDARYGVIEWTRYRGEVGRLLDWLEGAAGVTRYAEIFE